VRILNNSCGGFMWWLGVVMWLYVVALCGGFMLTSFRRQNVTLHILSAVPGAFLIIFCKPFSC